MITVLFLPGWDDIGYNFLVGGDGRAYTGRGWDREGAHTKGYNDKSVAISFMGNYMTVAPSYKMLTVAENLIQCGIDQVYVPCLSVCPFLSVQAQLHFC